MTFSLRCHVCHTPYPAAALFVCNKCMGPLEVHFDYDAVRRLVSRESIEAGPRSIWRYRALLPIEGDPRTGLYSGYTPLVKA
jgi:threonine synthase